jgi:hypothetical protein
VARVRCIYASFLLSWINKYQTVIDEAGQHDIVVLEKNEASCEVADSSSVDLLGNAIGSFAKNSHIDRWARLKGNIIGIKDIMFGRWAPERVADL